MKQNSDHAKTMAENFKMTAENFKNVEEINNFLFQSGKNYGDNSTSRNRDKSVRPTENSGIEEKFEEQMEEIKLKLAKSQVLRPNFI